MMHLFMEHTPPKLNSSLKLMLAFIVYSGMSSFLKVNDTNVISVSLYNRSLPNTSSLSTLVPNLKTSSLYLYNNYHYREDFSISQLLKL